MSKSTQPVRVVMLGGGYVSIMAYRALAQRLKREVRSGQVEVVVVAPDSQHIFHGWASEVLGGIIPAPHYMSPLRPLLKRARFICGRALAVDLEQQTVLVALTGLGDYQEQLSYDHLLIGTGSYDQSNGLPGLSEHAWRLKQISSTMALRNHLLRLFDQADSLSNAEERDALLSIVVAGGGFSGVEICATIAEMLQVAKGHYPGLQTHKAHLVMVHSGQALLPQYLPEFKGLTEYAKQQLLDYGVDVRFETRLTEVTSDGAHLSDGSFIPSQTVISTIGQTLIPIPGTEHLARTGDGRLQTDAYLHTLGQTNVWTGGDTASVIHPRSQRPCPANALWAMKHGEQAGDNIARTIQAQPLRPFTYPGLGQAASMGIGKGAVELYGIPFTGWVGWTMRVVFFLIYMPSRVQAARVAFNWLTLPFFGRHFVQLRSPETRK